MRSANKRSKMRIWNCCLHRNIYFAEWVKTASDFHPSKVASKWDVIVIGSGLSGLTTAKILAASSRKVLVLEQHDRAGGACHTFDLDRFEFDVGEGPIIQKLLPYFVVDGIVIRARLGKDLTRENVLPMCTFNRLIEGLADYGTALLQHFIYSAIWCKKESSDTAGLYRFD